MVGEEALAEKLCVDTAKILTQLYYLSLRNPQLRTTSCIMGMDIIALLLHAEKARMPLHKRRVKG